MASERRSLARMVSTGIFLIVWLMAIGPLVPAAANEVAQWNETALKVIDANGQSPLAVTRSLAMMHAAVHDALNAISSRYDAYYFEGPADPGASAEAAAGAAVHTVLVGVIPGSGSPRACTLTPAGAEVSGRGPTRSFNGPVARVARHPAAERCGRRFN